MLCYRLVQRRLSRLARHARVIGVLFLALFPALLYYADLLWLRATLDLASPYRDGSASEARGDPIRACIVVLTRNSELDLMLSTISSFETTFNARHHYPYVFLNDQPFAPHFRHRMMRAILRFRKSSPGLAVPGAALVAPVQFGTIPESQWSMPSFINRTRAALAREKMEAQQVLYGGSASYRLMCRYFSGYFFRHPLLSPFDYYWRIEPGVTFYCPLAFDPFVLMAKRGKKYSFVISLTEIEKTIPSLWPATVRFIQTHPQFFQGAWATVVPATVHRHSNNTGAAPATSDLFGEIRGISYFPKLLRRFMMKSNGDYNLCHFWSNFEIAAFDFFRSPAYGAYFEYLDALGGFFYERWGDAPIHSLAALAFLAKDEIHFMDEIGYNHPPFGHCPLGSLAASHCARPAAEPRWQSQRPDDSPFGLYHEDEDGARHGAGSACWPHHVFDTDSGSCLSAWLRL